MTVEAIICAYNEADILPWVLRHLREQGVCTYVIDNWSTDGTHDVACELSDNVERFPSEGPSPTYDWTRLLNRVETLAATVAGSVDWVMHHDADEIRVSDRPGESLVDGFARLDAAGWTAMNFRVVNYKPIDDWDGTSNPQEHFQYYESPSHYDRQLHVKAWKNVCPVDIHSRGGHEVWFPELAIAPERFVIKHYPIRGQKHGERKVVQDRQARWNHEERFDKGWHVQYDGVGPGHNFLVKPGDPGIWRDR